MWGGNPHPSAFQKDHPLAIGSPMGDLHQTLYKQQVSCKVEIRSCTGSPLPNDEKITGSPLNWDRSGSCHGRFRKLCTCETPALESHACLVPEPETAKAYLSLSVILSESRGIKEVISFTGMAGACYPNALQAMQTCKAQWKYWIPLP